MVLVLGQGNADDLLGQTVDRQARGGFLNSVVADELQKNGQDPEIAYDLDTVPSHREDTLDVEEADLLNPDSEDGKLWLYGSKLLGDYFRNKQAAVKPAAEPATAQYGGQKWALSPVPPSSQTLSESLADLTTDIGDEGLTDPQMAQAGLDFIGMNEHSIMFTGATYAEMDNMPPKVQVALAGLLDLYKRLPMVSWSGTGRFFKGIALDPPTYMGGLASLQFVRHLLAGGVKAGGKNMMRDRLLSKIKGSAFVGVEGSGYAGLYDMMHQRQEAGDNPDWEYNVGRGLTAMAGGAGAGFGLTMGLTHLPQISRAAIEGGKYLGRKVGEAADTMTGDGATFRTGFGPIGDVLSDTVPGYRNIAPHLTEPERLSLRKKTATRLAGVFRRLPSAEEMASVAFAGKAKRGWYADSTKAILEVFGADDARRFTALLAATSPQVSVESNAINALRIWNGWNKAGRPTDEASIRRIMGENVQGEKGEGSILNAWFNNTVLALSEADPANINISEGKVSSFMANLLDNVVEVTNDAWMANYANIGKDRFGKGKGPVYLGNSARVREAAQILSDRTGDDWTPREVQETVWSFTKALYEKSKSGDQTAEQILKSGGLTDADVASVPDFRVLLADGIYASILKEGGYGQQVERLAAGGPGRGGRGIDGPAGQQRNVLEGETGGIGRADYEQHLTTAARRIGATKWRREWNKVGERIRGVAYRGLRGGNKSGLPQSYRRTDRGTGAGDLNLPSGVSVKNVWRVERDDVKEVFDDDRISRPDIVEFEPSTEAAQLFRERISEAAASHPAGGSVTIRDDYSGTRLFMTDDQQAGFALDGDDIISVFNQKGSSHRYASVGLIQLAVQAGGRRLDAFDTTLPLLYGLNKFKAVARMKWDDKYAPEGWDYDFYKDSNNGRPDLVFMVFDPKRGKEAFYDKIEAVETYVDSYDAGVKVQKDVLKKGRASVKKADIKKKIVGNLSPEERESYSQMSTSQKAKFIKDKTKEMEEAKAASEEVTDSPVVPRQSQIDMRIRQMAFENDVQSGIVTENTPGVDPDEVRAILAQPVP